MKELEHWKKKMKD